VFVVKSGEEKEEPRRTWRGSAEVIFSELVVKTGTFMPVDRK